MYHFPGTGNSRFAQITANHGANIAAGTTNDTTHTLAGAKTSDRITVSPAAAGATGIVVSDCFCHTPGAVTLRVANVTTATVAAGTAVVYNLMLSRPSGT